MKKIFYFAASVLMMCACADSFLSEEPVGEFLPGQVESEENIEGIVTGAYAVLDGYYASDAINSGCSNWQFGDVVSDDAYKGGGGTGDQNQIHLMEIFNANPTGIDFEARWAALYEGIKRCNQAIRLLNGSEVKNKEQRLAEMRFLRGHYYFNLKIIYNQIPWIDETLVDPNEYNKKSNIEFSSDQLWEKILKRKKRRRRKRGDSIPRSRLPKRAVWKATRSAPTSGKPCRRKREDGKTLSWKCRNCSTGTRTGKTPYRQWTAE